VGGRRDIHHIWGVSLPLFQFVDHIHLVPKENAAAVCTYPFSKIIWEPIMGRTPHFFHDITVKILLQFLIR
jgi:hypothetical protein